MALINTPASASRLARAIVSDIALYNEAKISTGLKNDNIFEVLEKELKEGLDLYRSKVDPEVDKKNNCFNRAIVDILIKRNGNIKSQIW